MLFHSIQDLCFALQTVISKNQKLHQRILDMMPLFLMQVKINSNSFVH